MSRENLLFIAAATLRKSESVPLPAKSASASLVPDNLSQKQVPVAVKGENQAELVQCMLQDKKGPRKATDTLKGEVWRNQAFHPHRIQARREGRDAGRPKNEGDQSELGANMHHDLCVATIYEPPMLKQGVTS